jgi:hypothetical protein
MQKKKNYIETFGPSFLKMIMAQRTFIKYIYYVFILFNCVFFIWSLAMTLTKSERRYHLFTPMLPRIMTKAIFKSFAQSTS